MVLRKDKESAGHSIFVNLHANVMTKRSLFSILTHLMVLSGFSQSRDPESPNITASHHVKEKRIYRYMIDADGTIGRKYLYSTTSYNVHGLPLIKKQFTNDGSVSDKDIAEYAADSLEMKMTSYKGEDEVVKETTCSYDDRGNRVYQKQVIKSSGKVIEERRTYNSLNQNTGSYTSNTGKSDVTETNEYDPAGNCIRRIASFGTGIKKDTSLTVFDARRNVLRQYVKVGDSVRLLYEIFYTRQHLLLERHIFVQAPLMPLNSAVKAEWLKKADTRIDKYTYDRRGLQSEVTEIMNGRTTVKLKFEYDLR